MQIAKVVKLYNCSMYSTEQVMMLLTCYNANSLSIVCSCYRDETGVKRRLQIICMKERPLLGKTRCVYTVYMWRQTVI